MRGPPIKGTATKYRHPHGQGWGGLLLGLGPGGRSLEGQARLVLHNIYPEVFELRCDPLGSRCSHALHRRAKIHEEHGRGASSRSLLLRWHRHRDTSSHVLRTQPSTEINCSKILSFCKLPRQKCAKSKVEPYRKVIEPYSRRDLVLFSL